MNEASCSDERRFMFAPRATAMTLSAPANSVIHTSYQGEDRHPPEAVDNQVPPVLVLVFVVIMVFESNYTLFTRILFLRLEPSGAGRPLSG
jgi:hypothetical protein